MNDSRTTELPLGIHLGLTLALLADQAHTIILDPKLPLLATPLSFEQKRVPMLSGKRFKLSRSVTGILLENGATSVVTIPTEAIIRVLPGPDANGKVQHKGIVYVIWEARTVAIFAIDLEARGTEIASEREDHNRSARA